MSAVKNALIRSNASYVSAYNSGARMKGNVDVSSLMQSTLVPFDGRYAFSQLFDRGSSAQNYSLFRGWVYAAVNALAMEGARQPFQVGKLQKESEEKARRLGGTKRIADMRSWHISKMTKGVRERVNRGRKGADVNLELLVDHPILQSLEYPNPIQSRWQFIYSFISNMCLTGWGFVVGGEREDGGYEFYSIPTTWIRPDHTKGAFEEFRIVNPKNPSSEYQQEPLTRANVAFAYFPNPSDPLSALSPTQAQQMAIKVDDHIQTSQEAFFENGIFPSVIVTVGTNPHPDVPGGVRPRLTAAQRRQIYGAIRKVQGGVANYGNPAIVDGLIEKIERLSATQTEMGWEKSEKAVRTRILSAFGVHPFILGEEVLGSYAQSYVVKERFYDKVNTYLDLFSSAMMGLGKSLTGEDLLIWVEELKVVDPSMEKAMWESARTRMDVSQNEIRTYMGLPPDEDGNEEYIGKQNVQQTVAIATAVAAGTLSPEQGTAILEGTGLPSSLAKKIAGKKIEQPKQEEPGGLGAQGSPPSNVDNLAEEEVKSRETDRLIAIMRSTPDALADRILESV